MVLGILGPVGAVAVYLVNLYFKKANELEKIKVERQRETVRQLQSDMESLRNMAQRFERELSEFRVTFTRHETTLKTFENTANEMKRQWERTAEQMEKRYQALEGAEIIQAGKNTFILKTRRQP